MIDRSFEEWLYRKAEQNANNEILAFLMMILGMNLLIGGLVVTIVVAGEPILVPFMAQQPLTQTVTLGFILTAIGFIILASGFILVVHYDRQRAWYVSETTKSTVYKKGKKTAKTSSEISQEVVEKIKSS